MKNPPSNQSIAALAEGGSSKETVASPFSFPVSLSVYRLIMGSPVFLLTWEDDHINQPVCAPLAFPEVRCPRHAVRWFRKASHVYLNDADLFEEVCHRLHGVVVSQALHKDGVVVRVVLVVHCGETATKEETLVKREQRLSYEGANSSAKRL